MNTELFMIFCRDIRLRLSLDDDGLPVAKAIGKWSEDKFTEGWGEGTIGVVVVRETKNQYTHLKKRLINKFGCTVNQDGDTEGVFLIDAWRAIPLAKHLKIAKGRAKVQDPHWLRS